MAFKRGQSRMALSAEMAPELELLRAQIRFTAPRTGSQNKAHRPVGRAVAPKRPGRKRGHPGACRHKPDVIDESL